MVNQAKTMDVLEFFAESARDVAGKHIVEMGDKYEDFVVVNADLGGSTRSTGFIEKYPERSFNVGIAEQNLASFSAGLAHEGLHPLITGMAPFLSMRACEQVRTDICYGKLPAILMGTGAGYSAGDMGATHCALEDCAIMGSMNGMTVLEPGDPWMVKKMLDAAYKLKSPVYIRIGRESAEPIYSGDYEYEIGKALVPKEGEDGAFIVSGVCVQMAMDAANRLENEGIRVRVVDMHTIKPLDIEAVRQATRTGRVVTAQDHNLSGGLTAMVGAAIAELGITCQFKRLGCPDEFVPIATTPYLYAKNGYDAEGLYQSMKAMFAN